MDVAAIAPCAESSWSAVVLFVSLMAFGCVIVWALHRANMARSRRDR